MKRRTGFKQRASRLIACLVLSCMVFGCGGPPAGTDDSGDPLAYAEEVKNMLLDGLQLAKKGPPELGRDRVHVLRDSLSQFPERPVGEHEATYKALLNDLDELISMYRESAQTSQINSKIDETIARAETLPGQITPAEPDD